MCNVYIKKDGKTIKTKSDGSYKEVARMNTIISGVTRSRMVKPRLGSSYSIRTRAYSRSVNGKK